jgi:hypothetical protein
MFSGFRLGLGLVAVIVAGVPFFGNALAQRLDDPAGQFASAAPPAQQRTVRFSGYDWTVKSSTTPVDPGPNFFSDTLDNVFVDSQGRLHLKITFRDGKWWAAEVVNTTQFGYGKYAITVESPNVFATDKGIFGAFTYSDDSGPRGANREIDLEFSYFLAGPNNAQYVVQPFAGPGNLYRFLMPSPPVSTHSFNWLPFMVNFESSTPSGVIAAWTTTSPSIPLTGDQKFHLNLWLGGGQGPADGQEIEAIISSFTYTPASSAFFSLPLALFRGGF